MKKILLSLLFFGCLLGAPVVHAEVNSPEQVQVLRAQLVSLLTQLISLLQQQLAVMVAQENQQSIGSSIALPNSDINNSIIMNQEPIKVEPTEISFESLNDFIFINRFQSLTSLDLYANNIHNGDTVTFTINGQTTTKKFENIEGTITRGANTGKPAYGNYQFDKIQNLQPNIEYPYTLKVERGNTFATKTGSFKTSDN